MSEEILQDIFKEFLHDPKLYPALRQALLLNAWGNIVGDMVKKGTYPLSLQSGILTVNVSSHSMLAELELNKNIILQKYQKQFGKRAIKDIAFKTGRVSFKTFEKDDSDSSKTQMITDIIKNVKPLPDEVTNGVSEETLNDMTTVMEKIGAVIDWNNKNLK